MVDNAGSITNISNIRNTLKGQKIYVTNDTLQEYVLYLSESYLIYPVDIYDIQ
jgi:predicted AAA+ superfamily ATPase